MAATPDSFAVEFEDVETDALDLGVDKDVLPAWVIPASETTECLGCLSSLALAFRRSDNRLVSTRTRPTEFLFCSDSCYAASRVVRYARSALADGRINRAEIEEEVALKLGLAASGTYSSQARVVPRSVRRLVLKRDNGRCVICGSTTDLEIDHIGRLSLGELNDPSNLRTLCKTCHGAKTLMSSRELTVEHRQRMDALWVRVQSPAARFPADDDQWWREAWRDVASDRKALLG